ncbi:MAG: rRNA maturation RNase YbeY [Schleiferiaceae bacterium]|nr:rRNA maturation RNase YbeY [Schleiferiaceae bacterium]
MKITISPQTDKRIAFLTADLLKATYGVIGFIEDVSIAKVVVSFHTNDSLLVINKQFLDHDYFTDIITFDFSRGNKIIGELHISVDFIENFASQNGIVFKHEVLRVCIHGVLHLVGYNDQTEAEQKEMRMKEDFYLEKALKYLNSVN